MASGAPGRELHLIGHRAAAVLAALFLGCASAAVEDAAQSLAPRPTVILEGGCGPAPGLVPLYLLPFAVGEAFELTQGNCASSSHRDRFRYSFDFRMPVGTPVLAAREGQVTTVRSHGPDGTNRAQDANLVIVRHGDGQFSRYVHLRRGGVRVAVGDRVGSGDTLAVSGNSGQSRFPHLHFDVAEGCDAGRCVTIPSAFWNSDPPIPDEPRPVRALEQERLFSPKH